MAVHRFPLTVLLVIIFLAGTMTLPAGSFSAPVRRSTTADLRAAAAIVVRAMRDRDARALVATVHPSKGVRFSPGAFVDPSSDVVLSRAAIRRLWADRRIYRWGYTDGTGEPIELTPAQYIARYTLPPTALAPDSIRVDHDRVVSSSRNNAASVYPGAHRVEYYWNRINPAADPQFDWLALRLVFEPIKGQWFLVGIIRERWGP